MPNKDYSLNTQPTTGPPLPAGAATSANQVIEQGLIGDATPYGFTNGLAQELNTLVTLNIDILNGVVALEALMSLVARPLMVNLTSFALDAPDTATLVAEENTFFAGNPDKYLVSKNTFYNPTTLSYISVITYSTT